MQDGIIKETGNSRFLKSAITEATTWEQFRAALIAGTLPIDLAGINSDGWQQLATALSKANILSDTTAAKLDGVETPDAALSLLGRFHRGLGNEYVWEKVRDDSGYYETAHGTFSAIPVALSNTSSGTTTVQYADAITIAEDGSVSLKDPVSVDISYSNYASQGLASKLQGRYFKEAPLYGNSICYGNPSGAVTTSVDSQYWVKFSGVVVTTEYRTVYTHIGYVNSPDSDAYPPAESDGYTYTAMGQTGEKVRIATGSYTGTGTYGSTHQNSLTFSGNVKLLIISGQTFGLFVYNDNGCAYDIASGFPRPQTTTWGGATVSWYDSSSATYQFNASGTTYKYLALVEA